MKKFICLLMTVVLCAGLCACRRESVKLQEPVNFYYRNSTVTYGDADSLISAQESESAGYEDLVDLLNEYLKGPESSEFDTTFPASTKVLDLTVQGDTAYLGMNDSLSRLSGIDLTIACACITLTTAELTGVDTVTISASNETLDGAASITMNVNDLIFSDQSAPDATE